jgi:transcriptional regulator with XRE-family HTH domain
MGRNQSRALKVAQICRDQGIKQSDIAEAVGASQGQVSRILNGNFLRGSRLFEDVCLYVEQFETGVSVEAVRENQVLIEALRSVWDGSAVHAHALSTVIRSLSVLRSKPENRKNLKVD